jgi:hypothetical protein
MSLLQKGPKYNLHSKPKTWKQNLALEAETAILHLPLHRPQGLREIEGRAHEHPAKEQKPPTRT